MNHLLWKALPTLACGLAVGYGTQTPSELVHVGRATVGAQADVSTHADAARDPDCNAALAPVAIDAEPSAAVAGRGGRGTRMRYHVRLHNRIAGRGRAGLVTEVLTPSFQPVTTVDDAVTGDVASGGRHERDVLTPEALQDGFYVVRFSGAVAGSQGSGRVSTDRYMKVEDGEVIPLELGDFEHDANPNGSI